MYATPTLPGRCRLLARFPFKFSSVRFSKQQLPAHLSAHRCNHASRTVLTTAPNPLSFSNNRTQNRTQPIPMFVIKNTPKWVNHQGQNRVLEDDQIFLHIQARNSSVSPTRHHSSGPPPENHLICPLSSDAQERVLEQEMAEGKSLAQACYLPTPADVYVSAFRKWCVRGQDGHISV